MHSEEDFYSKLFDYPDKIVIDNEGNVGVLSISRALPVWSHIIKIIITFFARALL